jgi:RimJ/RimL family protein N-acetyltransferase
MIIEPETDRLLLRQWCPADSLPFAKLNADPNVMEFYLTMLCREASDAFFHNLFIQPRLKQIF